MSFTGGGSMKSKVSHGAEVLGGTVCSSSLQTVTRDRPLNKFKRYSMPRRSRTELLYRRI